MPSDLPPGAPDVPPVPPAVPPSVSSTPSTSSTPLAPPAFRPTPNARPPVPGWLWATFGLGMIPLGAVLGALAVTPQGDAAQGAIVGAITGFFLSLPMLGGLALGSRFADSTGARIVSGIAFAIALLVGLTAVAFAGCLCVFSNSGNSFR